MMPNRIQLSRKKGWRLPLDAKSVARPHKWGNECAMVWQYKRSGPWWADTAGERYPQPFATRIEAQKSAVDAYLVWITGTGPYVTELRNQLGELRGHDLACWCPLEMPCHADVLLELANS